MYRQGVITVGRFLRAGVKSPAAISSHQQPVQIVPSRSASYYDSKLEEAPEKYTSVERSYEEFKYVEKLLPNKYVPEAPQEYKVFPSGWRPQKPGLNLPYHVPRTRNHMLPVYYKSLDRGQKKFTHIRNVEGNIWVLEKEIGRFLKSRYPDKSIMTFVHECSRWVNIRGDHEAEIKEWLLDKGF